MTADKRLELSGGRVIEAVQRDGTELVRVRGRSGKVEITIELTDAGARLIVDAADLELRASRSVTVACADFSLEASGTARLAAADLSIAARVGDLALAANDAVDIEGEQILLNSDKPREPPTWLRDDLEAKLVGEIRRIPRRDREGTLAGRPADEEPTE